MLLIITYTFFVSNPAIAAVALYGAAVAAKSWTAEDEDAVAMFFFYGALIGCGLVWWS